MKLINEVNDSLRKIKKNKVCISHNDYKYLNMLWNKNDLYLLDFDACGMSLPSVALVEAAYALSLNHNQLDLRHYKLFLKSYLSIRNINEEEYDLGIKMAMNGKDNFSFFTNVIEKGDEQYIKNVKGKQSYNFSIWGKPSEYGYDIYDGKDLVANVIPFPQDEEVYQVRIHEKGNLFFIFMICLATERLQKDLV